MSVDGYGHSASHGALTGLGLDDHTQYNLRESLPTRHFTNSEPMTSYPTGRSMFECSKSDGFPQYGLLVTFRNSVNIYHSHQMILEGIDWTQMAIYQRRWMNTSTWSSWQLTAGAEPWQDAVLESPWTNYGAGNHNAQYRKEAGNVVRLRGTVYQSGGGLVPDTVFVLPSGYRPAGTVHFIINGGNDWQAWDVNPTTGAVVADTANAGWNDMAGIVFHADGS